MSSTTAGPLTLPKIANRRRPGTISRTSSTRLAATSVCWTDRPVTLPPGRAKLAIRPVPTGSPAAPKTIGMTDVACLAATIASVADVTMTSTLSRTNSVAISAKRSGRPSAQRYSIVMVRPSRSGSAHPPSDIRSEYSCLRQSRPAAPRRRRTLSQCNHLGRHGGTFAT